MFKRNFCFNVYLYFELKDKKILKLDLDLESKKNSFEFHLTKSNSSLIPFCTLTKHQSNQT